MKQQIKKAKIINALPFKVWDALTNPGLMKQWMGEPEMKLEIFTDWKVRSLIIIKVFQHTKFENKGTVLRFEPNRILKYNYLSSISRLPDKPENYTVIEFKLMTFKEQT